MHIDLRILPLGFNQLIRRIIVHFSCGIFFFLLFLCFSKKRVAPWTWRSVDNVYAGRSSVVVVVFITVEVDLCVAEGDNGVKKSTPVGFVYKNSLSVKKIRRVRGV